MKNKRVSNEMMHAIYTVEQYITNKLYPGIEEGMHVVGIIGSNPSASARSPALWNKTFKELGMNAHYFSFDVPSAQAIKPLLDAFRGIDLVLGFNVTMPYKVAVIQFLDEVDPKARAIGAVNTVVLQNGKFVGYNTDGQGAIDNILKKQHGQSEPLMETLSGKKVLIMGAGGAALASAFFLADELGSGKLILANRTLSATTELAAKVRKYQPSLMIEVVAEEDIEKVAPHMNLIFNATTKGQGGLLQVEEGNIFLEPYSSLAPAYPTCISSVGSHEMLKQEIVRMSLADIHANHEKSLALCAKIPDHVVFVDAIHTPSESVFLHHGRVTGHRTLNGKGMNISQALDGFFNKIMKPVLVEKGWHTEEMYQKIYQSMSL